MNENNPLLNQPPVQPTANQSLPTTPAPNKNSNFLVVIIIVLVLLIAGGVVFALSFLNKSGQKNNVVTEEVKKTNTITLTKEPTLVPTITLSASSSSVITGIPEGYISKQTLCYTIVIPQNNDAGNENDCTLGYQAYIDTPTVKNLLVGSHITSEWKEYKDLADMVANWQTSLKGESDKIISQEPLTIGSVPAERILVENEISHIQSSNVFIYLPNKYTSKGFPVTGFSILTTYSIPEQAAQQKVEENRLLSSWQWQ